jgi:chemotaxis protein CheC
LVRVVVGRALTLEDIVDLEDEALAETGNIILNSWVATLANLLKRGLKMSLPVVVRGDGCHIFETAGQEQSNLVTDEIACRGQVRPKRRMLGQDD